MTIFARASRALSLATLLSSLIAPPTRAIEVDDLGVRLGEPVHISLSTGFNGVVAAGIKHLVAGGQTMDGFCIDPFTRALSSSQGFSFVPLTQAPEAPWTLNSTKAVEIKDLWAMFYSPNMSQKNAAGLQLAIWEIVGGNSFQVLGKDYHASEMLAALHSYTGPGADLIALTGPGQDYVVQTPPGSRGEHNPTPTPLPHSTPTPTPHSTPTPTPHSTPTPTPTHSPNPTPTPTVQPTRPPPTPPPTPPPKNVPDSGATLPLFAIAILALLALNASCVPAFVRARVTCDRISVKRP
jgi:cell division septation protein DedD